MGWTEQGLPFAPKSHTSYKAARRVALDRPTKTARYLRLLAARGPLTDHEAADALQGMGLATPLSSINSIRGGAMACGLVVKGVEERKSIYGADCATWGLTIAGVAAVSAMKEQ